MTRPVHAILAALAAASIASSALADEPQLPPLPPAAMPSLAGPALVAEAKRAHDELMAAGARVQRADAAYAEMRQRDYPRGNARAAIIHERDAARADYMRAGAHYSEIVQQIEGGE